MTGCSVSVQPRRGSAAQGTPAMCLSVGVYLDDMTFRKAADDLSQVVLEAAHHHVVQIALVSGALLTGMFRAFPRLREIRIVVFYVRVRSAMAKLAGKGGTSGGCARRLILDDTLMLVAIGTFGHHR